MSGTNSRSSTVLYKLLMHATATTSSTRALGNFTALGIFLPPVLSFVRRPSRSSARASRCPRNSVSAEHEEEAIHRLREIAVDDDDDDDDDDVPLTLPALPAPCCFGDAISMIAISMICDPLVRGSRIRIPLEMFFFFFFPTRFWKGRRGGVQKVGALGGRSEVSGGW